MQWWNWHKNFPSPSFLLLLLTSRTSAFISDRLVATVPVDDTLGMKEMLFSDISL